MNGSGREELAAARRSALYLLSLLGAVSAELAWRPVGPLRLAFLGLTLGAALVLGALLAHAVSGLGEASLRRRTRLLALLLLPIPTLIAVAVAWSVPDLGAQAASALVVVQIFLLLLGEAFLGEMLVLWGGLVLALVAAAGARLPGAVALTAFLALSGIFFSLENVLTRLAPWPHAPAPPLGLVLRRAARSLAAPVMLLAVALAVLPEPSVHAQGRGPAAALATPEVERAYKWLILVALAGTGSLALAFRLLRGRGSQAPPLIELAESHVEAEELLEEPPTDDGRYAPARGRVIQAYVRMVSRAREAGFRLEGSLTPREIEGRVRRPETPLGLLTGLFMDARYGPDDPGSEAVARAESASREICSRLVVRRPGRRRMGRRRDGAPAPRRQG